MNATKIMVVIAVLVLIALAGCNSSAQRSYPSSPSGQQYVGGGCGVSAPASSTDVAQQVAFATGVAPAA